MGRWVTRFAYALVVLGCVPEAPGTTPTAAPAASDARGSMDPVSTAADPTAILTARSEHWFTERPCALSCHTTVPFMLAVDHLGPHALPVAQDIRAKAEARVAGWDHVEPWYGQQAAASRGTEAILNALVLRTDAALAVMLSEQRDDGSFAWLDFGLGPWEDADARIAGAALAAVAAGASTPATLRSFLDAHANRRSSLHNRIAILWAALASPSSVDAARRSELAASVRADQRRDGGWRLSGAGSEAYATAFATFALGLSDAEDDRAAAQRGRAWLRAHQQADGAWAGRSSNDDRDAFKRGLATDAATAFAVLALAGEAPPESR